MADQTLHGPIPRPVERLVGQGPWAPFAVIGSIVLHALVIGLVLRGLSGTDFPEPERAMGPDVFPEGYWVPVDLTPFPAREGRHVRLSRVAPNDGDRWMTQTAERASEFHLPESGRSATPPAGDRDRATPRGTEAGPATGQPRLSSVPVPPSVRTSVLACRTLAGTLTAQEQAVCDERFARAASGARRIAGTGEPERDARFAAEGAAALQAYEQRRLGLKPNSRANPCPGAPNPSDPCAVAIQGRIWSDRDGWFPDLPGRH